MSSHSRMPSGLPPTSQEEVVRGCRSGSSAERSGHDRKRAADVTGSTDYPPPSGFLGFVLPLATFLQNPTSLAPISLIEEAMGFVQSESS